MNVLSCAVREVLCIRTRGTGAACASALPGIRHVFFLFIPPKAFEQGRRQLAKHRLAQAGGDKWRRVEIEKLSRPGFSVAELTQPGQAAHRISLPWRILRDCLAEGLRRLDPDEVFEVQKWPNKDAWNIGTPTPTAGAPLTGFSTGQLVPA